MRTASRPVLSLLLSTSLLCTGCAVRAQEPPAPAQQQQQQNDLRARAYAAENTSRFTEAADAFLALAKAEPLRVDWTVAAGRCLGRSGRFKDAIELLDAARKRFPDVIDVPNMLARTLVLQTETDRGTLHPEVLWADAAELVDNVLRVAPDDEDARLLLAQIRMLQGDREDARRQAEQVATRHPKRAGAHVLLGRLAFDDYRRLRQQLASDRPEGQAQADLIAAVAAARDRARAAFTRAAELDPSRAHPHFVLGQIAWIEQQPDAAREHLAQALVIDPDQVLDHDVMTRGMTWQQRAEFYAQLRERHGKGTTAQPRKAATLRFHEGRARHAGRDWAAARDCFAAALRDDPEASNNLYYLFLCSYELGDHDAAEAHAARYAELGASAFADVLRGLDGDQRGAIAAVVQFLGDRAYRAQRIAHSRDLNHVIACLKDDADAWNNHAFLCRETGDFDAAFSSYEHAIEKEPESAQLWNDAAVVLQYHRKRDGDATKARTMYERALVLADKALADRNVTGPARERAQKAKSDAQANLAELAK